jgi:hypothetical protein
MLNVALSCKKDGTYLENKDFDITLTDGMTFFRQIPYCKTCDRYLSHITMRMVNDLEKAALRSIQIVQHYSNITPKDIFDISEH